MTNSTKNLEASGVSVVIGSYNRKGFLKKTIETLRIELESGLFPYKIIIVDGGSADGTLSWLIKQKDIITSVPTGKPGRPGKPHRIQKTGLNYARVKKRLIKGRISKVETEIIFGTQEDIEAALKVSKSSKKINTLFIERQNGTDRNRNSRKISKTLCFSKGREEHDDMTYFTMYSYNVCWPVRTLRLQENWGDRSIPVTPAMSTCLTDHVWTIKEWVFPVVQCT